MKKCLGIVLLWLGTSAIAQNLQGAWKLVSQNGKPVLDKVYIKIIQDGYFAFGAYTADSGRFISAGGGPCSVQKNSYTEVLDFYTVRPEMVGQKTNYTLSFATNKMTIEAPMHDDTLTEVWERISKEKNELTGNWVITGRQRDSVMTRSTPGARRTIKILSGGHFQWAAFNSETKEFMGTGGGTYTAVNGAYTEHIRFFSRDDKRVGATLPFSYTIQQGDWHHSGLSTAGAPIHEIWSKYALAYKPLN